MSVNDEKWYNDITGITRICGSGEDNSSVITKLDPYTQSDEYVVAQRAYAEILMTIEAGGGKVFPKPEEIEFDAKTYNSLKSKYTVAYDVFKANAMDFFYETPIQLNKVNDFTLYGIGKLNGGDNSYMLCAVYYDDNKGFVFAVPEERYNVSVSVIGNDKPSKSLGIYPCNTSDIAFISYSPANDDGTHKEDCYIRFPLPLEEKRNIMLQYMIDHNIPLNSHYINAFCDSIIARCNVFAPKSNDKYFNENGIQYDTIEFSGFRIAMESDSIDFIANNYMNDEGDYDFDDFSPHLNNGDWTYSGTFYSGPANNDVTENANLHLICRQGNFDVPENREALSAFCNEHYDLLKSSSMNKEVNLARKKEPSEREL